MRGGGRRQGLGSKLAEEKRMGRRIPREETRGKRKHFVTLHAILQLRQQKEEGASEEEVGTGSKKHREWEV